MFLARHHCNFTLDFNSKVGSVWGTSAFSTLDLRGASDDWNCNWARPSRLPQPSDCSWAHCSRTTGLPFVPRLKNEAAGGSLSLFRPFNLNINPNIYSQLVAYSLCTLGLKPRSYRLWSSCRREYGNISNNHCFFLTLTRRVTLSFPVSPLPSSVLISFHSGVYVGGPSAILRRASFHMFRSGSPSSWRLSLSSCVQSVRRYPSPPLWIKIE